MSSAGYLKHRVTLQRYTTTDRSGQDVQTPVDVATYWARVTPTGGSESSDESGTSATVSYKVVLRYGPDIKPKDRLLWGTRKLNIASVINVDGADIFLEISCTEVV